MPRGRLPTRRLTPDEFEAGLDWWVLSSDMQVGLMGQAKKEPIIVSQHYGLSDLSGFQNMQPSPSYFEGAQATPSYVHNMATPNWQTPMPSHSGTPNWQTNMPSHSATLNWQIPIPSHPHDVGIVNSNILNRERREARPSMYKQSPYMDFPPTTILPKKRGDKTMNKGKNANVSPFNLGNVFVDDNVGADDVMFMGSHETDNYFMYENVDPSKVRQEDYMECSEFLLHPYLIYLDCHMMGYLVPEIFWRELVPYLYMAGYHSLEQPNTVGWLSVD
ncbi:hypothetical protein Tco_0375127, partial [Tanacetum coccineum]